MESPHTLADALCSVDAMLRIEIAHLRRLIAGSREKLAESGGNLYPLPKPRRGKSPKTGVFGDKAPHEVALDGLMVGLDYVEDKLNKAEAALLAADEPLAICWTIRAQQEYFSSTARWQSGCSIPLWRRANEISKTNAKNLDSRYKEQRQQKQAARDWYTQNKARCRGKSDAARQLIAAGIVNMEMETDTIAEVWLKGL